MNRADVADWVARYREAWESNDPAAIADLFTADGRYHAHPLGEPWTGPDAIVAGWLGHEDAPGTTEFTFDVVAVDGRLGVVRAVTTYLRPTRRYGNLWLIELDPDGRSRSFTEYWMKEPTSG